MAPPVERMNRPEEDDWELEALTDGGKRETGAFGSRPPRCRTLNYADSRTTRVATRASALGESTVSTRVVIIGSNEGQSSRLGFLPPKAAENPVESRGEKVEQ